MSLLATSHVSKGPGIKGCMRLQNKTVAEKIDTTLTLVMMEQTLTHQQTTVKLVAVLLQELLEEI